MSVDADGPTSHGPVAASEAAAADGIYNFGPITHPNLYSANLLPDQPNPGAPTYSRGHTGQETMALFGQQSKEEASQTPVGWSGFLQQFCKGA